MRIRSLSLARSIAALLPWRDASPRRRLGIGVAVLALTVVVAGLVVGAVGGGLIAQLWTRQPIEGERIP